MEHTPKCTQTTLDLAPNDGLSRRSFLKLGGIAALSLALGTSANLASPAPALAKTVRERHGIKPANPKKFLKHKSRRFRHGRIPKVKYIVLHDTETYDSPMGVARLWDRTNDGYVAAHFVVGRDGTIVKCVNVSQIAHHAGYGSNGNNRKFGVKVKNDDLKGVKKLAGYHDYGMNSYSIGIEMCRAGNQGYTSKQLRALDRLIAYLDEKLPSQPTIIDHKMWRKGNSDTNYRFKTYLANYRKTRTHYSR